MSVYSYKCNDCDAKFEVEASIEEKTTGGEKFHCPKCKSSNTKTILNFKSFISKDDDGNHGGGCSPGSCRF